MSTNILILVIVEIVLMIGLPVAAVVFLTKRWTLPWRLALAGAATFIGSQVAHIPANSLLNTIFQMTERPLIVQAIVLGLSAGFFEEIARYLAYRYWQEQARSWRQATLFGVGHGGVEAILTGILVAVTLANVIFLTNVEDPAALELPEGVMDQVAEFWAMSPTMPLLALAERVMALVLHISLSTLVVMTFRTSWIWPLLAAILWHALTDAIAVYASQTWGAVAAEGALAVIALISAGILIYTRRQLDHDA